ncbi:hypothetical protein L1987_27281 [Smallanthus sonchifolius]|uniref:Uncharacterized protein n=1 Tax=Smallanthus sonchifolius TaxID=185202 RepID=A0ACB9ICD0_9ASTR|nr:hypothetical protein L1987_27281 [Smallanthus sonchifolius]
MALVMHSRKNNKNTYKALIAAEYVGVEVKLADDFEMGVANLTPEFLKMNPIGKVPVLETPDGIVFESNAIARYIARLKTDTCLFGSSLIEYGQIEQWIDFSSLEIDSHLFTWARPRLGFGNHLALVEEAAIASLKRALDALNTYLVAHTFLVGDEVTLADIIMTCNLYIGFKYIMAKTFTSEFPHVERYFWTMINQPNFSKILGEWKQAEAVPPVVPPKTNPYSKGKNEQEKVFGRCSIQRAILFGSVTTNTISFVTINKLFRGPEIPKFVMDECYDMELYEWTKVDLSDEAQKEHVNKMIEDHEPFEGEALLDAKCFK